MVDMKTKVLICKACGAALSQPVTQLTEAPEANRICDFTCEGGSAPVPEGYALIVAGEILGDRQRAAPGWNAENQQQVWMNLADIHGDVDYVEDAQRLSGCCGPSGTDGPNSVCSCGAEIGTESSDCWTWHMFVPLEGATEWRDE